MKEHRHFLKKESFAVLSYGSFVLSGADQAPESDRRSDRPKHPSLQKA